MDLLDCLAGLLGCTYLSDLHFAPVLPEQMEIIRSIPDEQFSLAQYQLALDYMTGKPQTLVDLAVARKAVVEALEKHLVSPMQ